MEKKKLAIPKNAEVSSTMISQILSGKYANSKVGTIIYPTNMFKEIKRITGKGHTGTIQNYFDLFASFKALLNAGWDIMEKKKNYFVLQKVSDGEITLDKIYKEVKKVRDDIRRLE
tara:strand:- start:3659 stop:4006 length:348 start_codon:yes stop_codon:yes gene_type:complete